ncbi:MAG: aminodeoxychorismate/anthranilate synthase component II [Gammaproteobacteria bacterium]|nr:MAG: aminodeoxychorismate/anthranilate synthase component II [Gammaproteobacteria bacterium]
MIVVIDNYDSFTYNLVQYLGELGAEVQVHRNDALSVAELEALAPAGLVISPGPCTPDEAGISVEAVRRLAGRLPILGVCLGHQSIAQAFGGRIVHAREVMHGKTSPIHHRGEGVFRGLPSPFEATRYHSLVVEREGLPACLEVTAWTEAPGGGVDEIMGLRHREHPVEGVQFHPESILTRHGHRLLANFLARCGLEPRLPPEPEAPATGRAGGARAEAGAQELRGEA